MMLPIIIKSGFDEVFVFKSKSLLAVRMLICLG